LDVVDFAVVFALGDIFHITDEAQLCPPGVEATLLATLMSISNGGAVLGGLIGAALTQLLGVTSENFQNLALLLVLCNVSKMMDLEAIVKRILLLKISSI